MSKDIAAQQVSMVFRGHGEPVIALDRIDLRVGAGRLAALIGPSGCGKSTFLRLVADIARPSAGTLTIGGETPEAARRRNAIGFVFQSPTLLPWRTVRQNVELPLAVVGRDNARVAPRGADALIELVGLKGFENALPHELSGGMQQRAAIARALMLTPDVLLLDEPFGALDEITRQKMNLELLRIWSQTGATTLLVTHSIAEAVFMADEVFVMSARPGRVAERIEVPLERPRALAMMRSEAFFACVNRIRDALFGDEAASIATTAPTAPAARVEAW